MIGIHVPYTWTDSTYMAISLAELALNVGQHVSVLSYRNHDNGVHPEWDNRVKSHNHMDFKKWLYTCDQVVWFDVQPDKLSCAHRFGCKNILVLTLEQLNDKLQHSIGDYDAVVITNKYIKEKLASRWSTDKLQSIPWDTGLPIVNKDSRISNNRIKVFVPVRSNAAVRYGARLFYALQLLLAESPSIDLHVAYTKRWTKSALDAFNDLQARWSDRVTVSRRPSCLQRASSYAAADWTLYVYSRDETGIIPLESITSGTPVVTFESGPMKEIVSDQTTGVVLKGHVDTGSMGWKTRCDPDLSEMVTGIKCLNDTALLSRIHTTPKPELESRRITFQTAWQAIWK